MIVDPITQPLQQAVAGVADAVSAIDPTTGLDGLTVLDGLPGMEALAGVDPSTVLAGLDLGGVVDTSAVGAGAADVVAVTSAADPLALAASDPLTTVTSASDPLAAAGVDPLGAASVSDPLAATSDPMAVDSWGHGE